MRRQIIGLRRQRRTHRQISHDPGVAPGTVGRILTRAGLNRPCLLEPARPANRYVYDRPGALLHLDTKQLGRFRRPGHRVTGRRPAVASPGAGWEYLHVAVDDASRPALTTLHPDKSGLKRLPGVARRRTPLPRLRHHPATHPDR